MYEKIYIYIDTYIYTYIDTYIYTYIHTYIYIYIYICINHNDCHCVSDTYFKVQEWKYQPAKEECMPSIETALPKASIRMWEKQLLIETSSKTDGSFSYMLATQWCLILFPEVWDSPLTFPRNSFCFEPFRWWRCSVQFWAKVDMLATHPPATESRDMCDIFGV